MWYFIILSIKHRSNLTYFYYLLINCENLMKLTEITDSNI